MVNNRIEIICKNNGKRIMAPMGSTLSELMLLLQVQTPTKIVGALVNNKPATLDTALFNNKTVQFVELQSPLGLQVYIRSLVFLLYKAIHDSFPAAELRMEHPVSNGFYGTVTINGTSITADQFKQVKAKAQELVQKDLPFQLHYQPRKDVIETFKKQNSQDTADLLKYSKFYYTYYYELDGLADFFPGLLVPSTRYLDLFDLCPYYDGFLLRVPSLHDVTVLGEMKEQNKMFEIFRENREWCRIIGLNNIPDLNKISKERLSDLIKVAEALHEKKIARISDQIAANKNIRVVLVAGPSSSGKTTFSKRLGIQLAASMIRPITLSLDNYYLTHDKTPKDEFGELDFESLYALDLPLFNEQLNQLIAGKTIVPPVFNFETGQREKGKPIQLKDNEVLIIEGIHGLNPELTASVPDEKKYKVYVSALTTLSMNNHNWVPTSDNRLLRRIIRDYKYRNYPAENTLERWASVRRGEDKWILPYQENADAMFNSSLLFEMASIKKQAEPLLQEVPQDSDCYPEARRLLNLLQYFIGISYNSIPQTSLLREFLGGSGFRY